MIVIFMGFFFSKNISKGAEREVLKVQSCLKESSEGSGWGRVGAIFTQIQKLAVPLQRMLLLHLNTQPNIEFRLGFFVFFLLLLILAPLNLLPWVQ